jgi:hypothetical protein
MDLGLVLAKRYADKLWTLIGSDYESLEWKDSSKKPTKKALEALWEEVKLESVKEQVDNLRREEYQKVSDPLFFAYQRGEVTKEDWLNAVKSVKEKYPNPYSANSQE